jgi:hypothetical protein
LYSREQAAQIRKAFWTTFGQYLRPIPGAEGDKVNWINYKTGFKGLDFKLEVDKKQAYIGIVLSQKDPDLRELFYEQLEELKAVLHAELGEQWIWERAAVNGQYQKISQVYTTLPDVSIFREADWPAIISFLKPRLLALDEFWSMGKFHFEELRYL